MPIKGIKLPLKAKAGRLQLLGDDEYIRQLVELALGDSESTNPFQDIGLGEFMIFENNIGDVQGRVEQRLSVAFAPLERDEIARVTDSRVYSGQSGSGEMFLDVEYENMENGKRDTVTVPFPNGASTGA